MYLLAPFILQKFKKILRADSKFLGPKWQQIFLVQIIIIIFIYLLALFTEQNFKKFFQQIQSYEDVQFLDPKRPISPNEIFFRKLVIEPCFFHSCQSTSQKSKSDINLLVKYWQLKILKSHWLRAIFGYNLRTRFFPSMQFSQNVDEP